MRTLPWSTLHGLSLTLKNFGEFLAVLSEFILLVILRVFRFAPLILCLSFSLVYNNNDISVQWLVFDKFILYLFIYFGFFFINKIRNFNKEKAITIFQFLTSGNLTGAPIGKIS